jgi:hypothetical protein
MAARPTVITTSPTSPIISTPPAPQSSMCEHASFLPRGESEHENGKAREAQLAGIERHGAGAGSGYCAPGHLVGPLRAACGAKSRVIVSPLGHCLLLMTRRSSPYLRVPDHSRRCTPRRHAPRRPGVHLLLFGLAGGRPGLVLLLGREGQLGSSRVS